MKLDQNKKCSEFDYYLKYYIMPKKKTIDGLDFVRPPMLEMKKVDETDDYKEYNVTTFRTPKDRNSTNKEDESYWSSLSNNYW